MGNLQHFFSNGLNQTQTPGLTKIVLKRVAMNQGVGFKKIWFLIKNKWTGLLFTYLAGRL